MYTKDSILRLKSKYKTSCMSYNSQVTVKACGLPVIYLRVHVHIHGDMVYLIITHARLQGYRTCIGEYIHWLDVNNKKTCHVSVRITLFHKRLAFTNCSVLAR